MSGGGDWAADFTYLLEGRAASLFVVLAGVGISLAKARASLMLRRALFLFAIGLLNQTIFEADILHYYGVYFICAIPMMWLCARNLLIAAMIILALSLAMLVGLNYEAGWDWDGLIYTGFWTPTGFVRNLFYNGWHPVFPWLTFLLFGMWIGRLSLHNRATQIKLALAGILWTALVINTSAWLSAIPELAEITGLSPIPPGPLFILAGIGTSTAMIGLTLLVTPILTRLRLTKWLAVPGRQSLTLYVAHILIGMGVMEAMGWLDGSLSSPMIFVIGLGFAVLSSLYAQMWLRISRRGPLEGLMRLLTEGKMK